MDISRKEAVDDSNTEIASSQSSMQVTNENGDVFLPKRLTLTFRDVTVRVTAPVDALGETVWSEMNPRRVLNLFRKGKPKRVRQHPTIKKKRCKNYRTSER